MPSLWDIELEIKEYLRDGLSPAEAAEKVSRDHGISIHKALELADNTLIPMSSGEPEDLVFKDPRVLKAYADAEEWFMNKCSYEISAYINSHYRLVDNIDRSVYEVISTFHGEVIGTVQTYDHSDFSNSFSIDSNVDEFLWYVDQEVLFGYKEDNDNFEDNIIEQGRAAVDRYVLDIVGRVFPKVKSRYVEVLVDKYLKSLSGKIEVIEV